MGYLEESKMAGRELLPDLVRAFALIGIAVVNVALIAYPMMDTYHSGGFNSPIDKGAYWLVNAFFTSKSYTLFSFMFGVGFAYQIASAERKGVPFKGRYTRRIIGLLILGLLHVALLFQGDILVLYALVGTLLYFFRNIETKTLITLGLTFYAVQIALVGLFAFGMTMGMKFAPDEMAKEVSKMAEMTDEAISVYGNGTFTQSIIMRYKEFGQIITAGTMVQGMGTLAFFILGFAAVKSGIINNPNAPIYRKFRRICLPIGIIGSMLGAWVLGQGESMMDPKMMLGMFLITLFSPFSTAGYLGLIAKWAARPDNGLKTFMARGGTATLTAYLMQGLIMSLIFNNYGLGWYTQYGAATCILIAFLTAVFTIIFASLWRTRFTRGPMEMGLRGFTYWGEKS